MIIGFFFAEPSLKYRICFFIKRIVIMNVNFLQSKKRHVVNVFKGFQCSSHQINEEIEILMGKEGLTPNSMDQESYSEFRDNILR